MKNMHSLVRTLSVVTVCYNRCVLNRAMNAGASDSNPGGVESFRLVRTK